MTSLNIEIEENTRTLAFRIIMSTDLFAASLFPIGDRPIWSDFRSQNLSVGTRMKAYPLVPRHSVCSVAVLFTFFSEGQIRFF